MDSLTQAALGASIAGVIAPTGQRRKAMLIGAILGTLPDFDVLIDYGDAVDNFTRHRGFSHSLLVLVPAAFLLWWVLKTIWQPVRASPQRWLALIVLVLVTHPLLDAHTAYGTQLFWPLDLPPAMWATMFIIDPFYTLPLLAGVLAVAIVPAHRWSVPLLRITLTLSFVYLAWSWVAQGTVRQHARSLLAAQGLQDAPLFVTPAPFNTLLWRIVVMTPEGYLEGFDSLLLDEPNPEFTRYEFDRAALTAASSLPSVERLLWFSHGFVAAEVRDGRLLISDLRMGQAPSYVFTHAVAIQNKPNWAPIRTELLAFSYEQEVLINSLRRIWGREPGIQGPD